jgi:inosine/xanthosine triphosphate pyrophosphatase family protein
MPPEEKRLYSHRARAVRALLESGALKHLLTRVRESNA